MGKGALKNSYNKGSTYFFFVGTLVYPTPGIQTKRGCCMLHSPQKVLKQQLSVTAIGIESPGLRIG
jgi:hypothetical protein